MLPLSMTCRAMRLRLLPWIWERIEAVNWKGRKDLVWRTKAIVRTLRADPGLRMGVKYSYPPICPWI